MYGDTLCYNAASANHMFIYTYLHTPKPRHSYVNTNATKSNNCSKEPQDIFVRNTCTIHV